MGVRTFAGAFCAALLVAAGAGAQPSVKLGLMTHMNSVYADYSGRGSVAAARLTIAESGMADKVELVIADHQNKPDVDVSLARDWFEQKGEWDQFSILGVVPAAEAFRTVEQSKCKLR